MSSSDKIVVGASQVAAVRPNFGYKGGDPEVMLVRGRQIISSTELLTEKRKEVLNTGTKIFSDGFQAEINFPANTCREAIIYAIRTGLVGFQRLGVGVKICPIVRVNRDWLINESPVSVRVSGCKPDFDAYTDGGVNPPVQDFDTLPIRFAGGHVSVDLQNGPMGRLVTDFPSACRFIKLMDRIVGIFSVLAANGKGEQVRRQYYGKPGCFRYHKGKYIEYRSMSNWWMASPVYTWIVYGLTDMATSIFSHGLDDLYNKGITDDEVKEIMMGCDAEKAKRAAYKMFPSLIAIGRNIGGIFQRNFTNVGLETPVVVMSALMDWKPSGDTLEEWEAKNKSDVLDIAHDPNAIRKKLELEDGVEIPNGVVNGFATAIFPREVNGLHTYLAVGRDRFSLIKSALKLNREITQAMG